MYRFVTILNVSLLSVCLGFFGLLSCSKKGNIDQDPEHEAAVFLLETILEPARGETCWLTGGLIYPFSGCAKLDIEYASKGYLITPNYLVYFIYNDKIVKCGKATFWVKDKKVMWTDILSKEFAEDFGVEMEEAPDKIQGIVSDKRVAADTNVEAELNKYVKEDVENDLINMYLTKIVESGNSIKTY